MFELKRRYNEFFAEKEQENDKAKKYQMLQSDEDTEELTYSLFITTSQLRPYIVTLKFQRIEFNSKPCFLIVIRNISSAVLNEQAKSLTELQEQMTKSMSRKIEQPLKLADNLISGILDT